MSLKSQIILIFSILLALLGSIIFTMQLMAYSHERVALAQLNRFEASELASRLQQSSDDLTRMARTYAVTGDLAFREYFNEIVAIRDGKAQRPENYSSIYWDFVTASGERPSPFGPPAALIDQMKALREVQGELEQTLNKEIELNEMQRQFVSMASHEFRTPLAIIDGTAQRLKNRARKNRLTSEDALNRVEKIRNAVT